MPMLATHLRHSPLQILVVKKVTLTAYIFICNVNALFCIYQNAILSIIFNNMVQNLSIHGL